MDDVDLVPLEGEAAIGLTGANAGRILTALGLPALSDPPAQVRAQWNGAQVLVRRGYGILAEHYALWIADGQAGALWEALAATGAKPVGAAPLRPSASRKEFLCTGSTSWTAICPRRPRRCIPSISTRGATWARRSSSGSARVATSIGIFVPLSWTAPCRLQGRSYRSRVPGGHITSAAVLPLSGITRVFALGVMRAEAEARNLPLNYEAEGTAGTAGFRHLLQLFDQSGKIKT